MDKTIILVGRSGNGKSATGNSIIEADVLGTDSVTMSCRCVLDDDQILTVIDTSGPFDITCIEPETLGIHAVVVVLSLRNRYSVEESMVIESLTRFFGTKLIDYMIVVFTHGDALEDMSLDYYLAHTCPAQLAKILQVCGNRFVIFDNVTQDKFKKYQQREEFLRLVDEVFANNGGIPYTDGLFVEQKEGEWEVIDEHTEDESCENGSEFNKAYEDEFLEMESKHREMTLRLEKQLEDEQVARMQAEADAQSAKTKANDEISKVREDLKRAQREARKLRKTHKKTDELLKKMIQEKKDDENQKKTNNCAISELTSAIEHQIESKLRETTLRLENQLADKFAQMQAEFKAQERKSNDEMRKLREDMERAQRHTIEHQIDSKLRERILELEKTLADKQVARLVAEAKTLQVQNKLNDEISKLRDDLERAQRDGEMLRLTDPGSQTEGISKTELSIPTFGQTQNSSAPKTNTTLANSPLRRRTPSACHYGVQSPQPLQPTTVNFGQSRQNGNAAAPETGFGDGFASFWTGGGAFGGGSGNARPPYQRFAPKMRK